MAGFDEVRSRLKYVYCVGESGPMSGFNTQIRGSSTICQEMSRGTTRQFLREGSHFYAASAYNILRYIVCTPLPRSSPHIYRHCEVVETRLWGCRSDGF